METPVRSGMIRRGFPGPLGWLVLLTLLLTGVTRAPLQAQADEEEQELDEAPIAEELESPAPVATPAGPAPTGPGLRRDISDLLARKKYDEAIRLALGRVDAVVDPVERAEVLRLLGQLFLALPHFGTIAGGTFLRGEWKPGWHEEVLARDWKTAVGHFEKAREIYAADPGIAQDPSRRRGRIECDHELIGALTLFSPHDPAWAGPGTPWSSDAGSNRHPFGLPADPGGTPVFEAIPGRYTQDLSPLAKVKFLFAELQQLAREGVPGEAARALYRQAMVFRARYGVSALHRLETWFADPTPLSQQGYRTDLASLADDETLTLVGSRLMKVKLPPEEDVLGLLARVRTEHAGSPWAVEALYATGLYHQSRGQFDRALAAYDELEKAHPSSDRRKEVQEHRTVITRTELWIEPIRVHLPGEGIEISVEYRNVAGAQMRIRRVDVSRLIQETMAELNANKNDPTLFHNLADPAYMLTQPAGKAVRGGENLLGEVVSEWTAPLGENTRDYQHAQVPLPPLAHGLYSIEASAAGQGQAVSTHNLIWVEDIALIEKDLGEKSLFMATDARTGAPLVGASLEHLVFWNRPAGLGSPRKHWAARLDTTPLDAHGMGTYAPTLVDSIHPHVATYLTRPDGTVALLPSSYWSSYTPFALRWSGKKALVFLDRPFHRPGETVRFVAWLRDRIPTGLALPALGTQATVQLVGAAGSTLARTTLGPDSRGSLSGELTLPADAPPGPSSLVVDGYHSEGNKFEVGIPGQLGPRLELRAAAQRIPAGGTAAIEVRIITPAGSPSPAGWITYRLVRRTGTAESGTPPVVLSGTAATDEAGRLDLRLMMPGETGPGGKQGYNLQIGFIDSGGRHLEQDLDLEVTREAFQPRVEMSRALVDPGSPIELTVVARTLDGVAMAATAQVEMRRAIAPGGAGAAGTDAPPGGVEIPPQDVEIPAAGSAPASFPAQPPGHYLLSATFTDGSGASARAEGSVWVLGGQPADYDFGHLELVPEKSTAAPGEHLRVMIGTSRPGATALVAFRPLQGALNEHQPVSLAATPAVLDLVVTEADTPNLHVEASLVADGKVHTVTREIAVPVSRPPLALTISEPRKDPAAGGAVDFTLQATDAGGAPLNARLAFTAHEAPPGEAGGESAPFSAHFFQEDRRGHEQRHRTNLEAVMRSRAERLDPRALVVRHPAIDWSEHWMRSAQPPDPTAAVTFMGVGALMGDPTPQAALPSPTPSPGAVASETASSASTGPMNWFPVLDTDAQGQVTVRVKPPARPVTWRVRAIAMTADGSLGSAATTLEVEGSWALELTGPPYAIQGDEMEVTAHVTNGRSQAGDVVVEATVGDERLRLIGEPRRASTVGARGSTRVRFRARAMAPGRTALRVTWQHGEERQEVVHEARILPAAGNRFLTRSTFISSQDPETTTLEIDVPEGFDPAGSQLRLSLAPTPLHVGIESLQALLQGAAPETLGQIGRILPLAHLHELLSRDTSAEESTPFGSLKDINRWLGSAVAALLKSQDENGGWGLWESSTPTVPVTAFACLGLLVSRDPGSSIETDSLEKGLTHLEKSIRPDQVDVKKNPEILQDLALAAYVLARAGRLPPTLGKYLFDHREELPVGTLALAALAFQSAGDEMESTRAMFERLLSLEKRDEATGKVWFEGPQSSGTRVEDQAWALSAFCAGGAVDPAIVNGVVRWLLEERRGTVWDTPRSTFVATLALFQFSAKFLPAGYQYDLSVSLNGNVLHETKVTSASPSGAHPVIWVPGEHLRAGKQPVVIRRIGQGSLAVAVVAILAGVEGPEPAGGWPVIKRITPVEPATAELHPGDVIEVSLQVKPPEPGKPVLLEDPHPAGFTVVDSPPPAGADITREAHEDRTLFRFEKLGSRGAEVRYRLRAEHGGRYRVPAPTLHRADASGSLLPGKVEAPSILEVTPRP